MVLSKNQIDKLGERLRDSEVVSDDDLALLQEVRATYEVALAEVTDTLAAMEHKGERLRPTSRLKTVGTLIDKLRRETARLSQVDDIAGARVVIDGTLIDQDDVVTAICERIPGSRVKDRRVQPNHGYRAVHVIAPTPNGRVEIQVRTVLQDRWAQLFESMGDVYGRAIRYGGLPDDPDELGRGNQTTRREEVALAMELAVVFAALEDAIANDAEPDDDFVERLDLDFDRIATTLGF